MSCSVVRAIRPNILRQSASVSPQWISRTCSAGQRMLKGSFTISASPSRSIATGCDRPHPAVRRHPAGDHRRGLGRDRSRRAPARNRAQPVPARYLPRRRCSRTGSCRPSWCSATRTTGRDDRAGPAARHLRPHQRHRSGARRPGRFPRAGGQWRLAVGRVLRGREPPPDAARVLRSDERRRCGRSPTMAASC